MAGWSWAGASEWLDEKKAEEKDLAARDLARKDKLISMILPELLDRRAKRQERLQAASSRISFATTDLKMDQETAAILEATGQLEGLNTRLKKLRDDPNKNLNTNAIKTFSEKLLLDIAPEKIAAAMNYAIDKDFLDEPSAMKYIETLYAADADEILSTAGELSSTGSGRGPRPDIGRVDFNERVFTQRGESSVKTVKDLLSKTLQDRLGGSEETLPNGNRITNFKDPDSARSVLDNAEKYYFEQMDDAFNQKSPEEVLYSIVQQTEAYLDSAGGLKDLATTPFGFDPATITPLTGPRPDAIPGNQPPGSPSIEQSMEVPQNDDDVFDRGSR